MTTYLLLLVPVVAALVFALVLAKRGPTPPAASASPPLLPDVSAFDDESFRDRVMNEIDAGRRIEAIRLVRERTRLGLAEARALVEALARGDASVELDLTRPAAAPLDDALEVLRDPDFAAQLVVLIGEGNRIEAIRRLRDRTGLGLREAKDAIEQLERGG
jgi:ribosomal protein L7/L12